MTFRFRSDNYYEGEKMHGGCGYVNRNAVYVLKRTKNHIVYRDNWGNVYKTKRKYHLKCEFFDTRIESFYADSIGKQMSFLVNDSIGKLMLKTALSAREI
ncbi:MAG: hypothetical protein ACYC4S_20160 [Rhodoferax sp.]